MKIKAYLVALFLFFGVKSFSTNITVVPYQDTICAGQYMILFWTFSDTLSNGTYEIQLSDPLGSFSFPQYLTAVNIFYPQMTGATIAVIPSTIFPGNCYRFRMNRVNPAPFITGDSSMCVVIQNCPNTVTTLQPAVTLDTVCSGSVIDVPFYSTGSYVSNTYIAQLSDASGNFTNPTILGSLISNITYDPANPTPDHYPPGYIAGLIPDTVSPGVNYYIRVIATGPSVPPSPTVGSPWGPFSIRNCDIMTNNGQDISLCVMPTTNTTCINVPVNVNFYNSAAVYYPGNQFQVQLLSQGPIPPPMTPVGANGAIGAVTAVNDATLQLCVGPLSTMLANNIPPGNYYMRIIATNSSMPNNSVGSIVRFKWGSPADTVPAVSVVDNATGFPVTHACIGDVVRYTVTNANLNTLFTWTGPFVGSPLTRPAGQPFLIFFTGSSSYNFTINVHENGFGCHGDTATITLPVYGKPNVNIIGPTTVCVGDTVHYNTAGQISTFYLWSVYNPHSHIADTINNNAWFTFDSAGTYQVSVYAANACFDSIGYKTITVNPVPPVPLIIQSGDTLTCTITASTYTWYRNFVLQPAFTTQSIVITPGDNGLWEVEVSNSFNCRTMSQLYSVDVGIEELAGESISIFPNPAINELAVSSGQEAVKEMEIYDVMGQRVFPSPLTPLSFGRGDRGEVIDISSLVPGIYFIKLKSSNGERALKFVKH